MIFFASGIKKEKQPNPISGFLVYNPRSYTYNENTINKEGAVFIYIMEFKKDDDDLFNELLGDSSIGHLNSFSFRQGSAGDEHLRANSNSNSTPTPTPQLERLSYSLANDSSHLVYPGTTPAQQQELLQQQRKSSRPSVSAHDNHGSFIDEYLMNTKTNDIHSGNHQEWLSEPLFQETLNDDALSTHTDDLTSSLGSSIHSDFLSPSSSFNYHPQQLNSVDSNTYSQYLSSSLRSPSTSLRTGNYLSSSLRSQPQPQPQQQQQQRLRQMSLSSVSSTPMDPGSGPQLTQEERLRRRREFHNAVERRRRELIKLKIKELGKLVPPGLLNYNDQGKEIKPNKGVILNRSVEYLEYLQQVLEVQDRKKQQLLTKIDELEAHKRTIGAKPPNMASKSFTRRTKVESISPEQIIDTRAVPHILDQDSPAAFNDDLRQFLSGDLIEAEDNAKLMFGSGRPSQQGENPADFLLDFDK